MKIILNSSDLPYKSEGLANNGIRLRKIKDAVAVEVEGGWGIKTGLSSDKLETPNSGEPTEAPVDINKTSMDEEVTEASPAATQEVDDEATIILLKDGIWQSAKNAFDIIKPYLDKRFRYKWANPKNKQETRIEELRAQGWQIDTVMKAKIRHLSAHKDQGNIVGESTIIRGKILMRIPLRMAEQRNKHYSDMANNGLKQEQEKFKEESQGKSYGGIHIS